MITTKTDSIEAYISGFPKHIQEILEQIRSTIKSVAPDASEAIKYAIPTFILNGNLVHFAGYKNHIGLYPAPSGMKQFEEEIAMYKTGKGTLQFPIDQPMPLDLIARIVKFRVQENEAKTKKKITFKSVIIYNASF
ncbi:iron chaperone [Pedobacter psychroterrae]|uniref:YdhG-like domain-containing protein n=1 Tax=Pedobacter psychroterrae TaxID=2530453 RepID=A0A4R0NRK5_9SPHI|nr:DUF1801 domain-containing protein [Pedobacter psychroterrae]TCD03762.1 hypothetical protein EZ437_07365 [Pedobacter psychroterrae]